MKKIIKLGNNIKVEFENDEYKIISANGSVIRLDDEGEFLSCENAVAQKEANERKAYLSKFKKITAEERIAITTWLNSDISIKEDNINKNFFVALEKSLKEVDYEFYVILVFDTYQKIELFSNYRNILPKYYLERAKPNEVNLLVGHNLAIGEWTYEETFDNKDILSSIISFAERVYVLKLSE